MDFEHYGLLFSESEREISVPGPDLGEHNQQVHSAVGYSTDEIRALAEAGVLE
jgi:crotonobetainyl-CoA:carnitine CoA-transferase CaiB-like acyl-CoA transferase